MSVEKKIVILGCNGQVGRALAHHFVNADAVSREELDIADFGRVEKFPWSKYDIVINAAAYVNADESETADGREKTWLVNALGPRNLTIAARKNDFHLIHISSEYVFDGRNKCHDERENLTPLSVYGQTKAAADLIVGTLEKYHILRTTWIVGDGHNFVKTMHKLADLRIDPQVVNDQFGRLTFASEIARAIDFIITKQVAFGTYNISNSGKIKSWGEIARDVFEIAGYPRDRVKLISTEEYKQSKSHFAARPENSDLNLMKIQKAGFVPRDYEPLLIEYVGDLKKQNDE